MGTFKVNGNLTVKDIVTAGDRIGSYGETTRIVITPRYHTGGPWSITSNDPDGNAYTRYKYGNRVLMQIRHDGIAWMYGSTVYFGGSSYYITNSGAYYNGTAEYANNSDKLDGYHLGDLYWANIQVQHASNTETVPIFAEVRTRKLTLLHPTNTSERGVFEYKHGTYGWGDYLTTNSNGPNIILNAADAGGNTFVNGYLYVDAKNQGAPLTLKGGTGSYREGLRIFPTNSWSDILLGGNDLSADSGTSTNSWFIGNNNSNLYINRGDSSGANVRRLWGHVNGWTLGNTAENGYNFTVGGNSCFKDNAYFTVGQTKGMNLASMQFRSVSSTDLEILGGQIRFSNSTAWDWNAWAGLRYNNDNKTIYLGIADGSIFTANSAQSGGTLSLPGCFNFDVGGHYSIKYTYTPAHAASSAYWYRIAVLSGYFNVDIHISGGWNWGSPVIAHVRAMNRNGEGYLTEYSGMSGSHTDYVKLGRINTDEWALLVHHNASGGTCAKQEYTISGIGTITPVAPGTVDSASYGAETSLAMRTVYGTNITSSNIGSQSVNYANSAGSASTATTATYLTYLSNHSHSVTLGISSWNNGNPWGAGNTQVVYGMSGKVASASSDTADFTLTYGTASSAGGAGWFVAFDGGICVLGNSYAGHFYENSDVRYKNIIENFDINYKLLANLPLFKYNWTNINDPTVYIGSSAQAANDIMPEIVSYQKTDDFYRLDYSILGTIAGIVSCRELVKQDSEITKLKKRIAKLEKILKDNNLLPTE